MQDEQELFTCKPSLLPYVNYLWLTFTLLMFSSVHLYQFKIVVLLSKMLLMLHVRQVLHVSGRWVQNWNECITLCMNFSKKKNSEFYSFCFFAWSLQGKQNINMYFWLSWNRLPKWGYHSTQRQTHLSLPSECWHEPVHPACPSFLCSWNCSYNFSDVYSVWLICLLVSLCLLIGISLTRWYPIQRV